MSASVPLVSQKNNPIKPYEWGLLALDRKKHSFRPPTFELEMQLTQELLGRRYLTLEDLEAVSGAERDALLAEKAETYFLVAEKLPYSFIRVRFFPTLEDELKTIQFLRRIGGDDYLLTAEADYTFRIPDGNEMEKFIYDIADRPDEVLEHASELCNATIERGKRLIDAGIRVITMCADYCFNDGPFLSPKMWDQFIGQFYYRQVYELKEYGAYIIKHTDGQIMPLLDRLVTPPIDALHSIDPIAGVDIAEVKKAVGDQVCLIGNVDLSKLQQGPREAIRESAEYCLQHASQGGGYIYSSCNSIFEGVPLENYQFMLSIWEEHGDAPIDRKI
jgi:uroporphyrinogen decarboxylase